MRIIGQTAKRAVISLLVVGLILGSSTSGRSAVPAKKAAGTLGASDNLLVQYSQSQTGPWQDTNANTTVYVWQGNALYFQAIDTQSANKTAFPAASVLWRQGHSGNGMSAATLPSTQDNPNPGNPYRVTFNTASQSSTDISQDVTAVIATDNLYKAVHVVVVTCGMAIQKTDQKSPGQLTPQQDQNPGGYVPVNDDNDNYSFTSNDPANAGYLSPNADKDLTNDKLANGIPTEKDLVPLVLKPVSPTPATAAYQLVWGSKNIKIWTNHTKMTPDNANSPNADHSAVVVSGQTTFDATKQHTVYVEGLAESAAAMAESISLNCTIPATQIVSNTPTTYHNVDSANFTVYEVTGPANVPNYSKYTYNADIPGGGTGTWASTGGTVTPVAGSNKCAILWGAGGDVEHGLFTPSPGFVCDRQVNVVNVTFGNPNVMTFSNKPVQSNQNPTVIQSTDGSDNHGVAMLSQLKIAAIKGPAVNNAMRGVRFIQLGFIQLAQIIAENGQTDAFFSVQANQNISLERSFDLQNPVVTYLDQITKPPSKIPWYDSQSSSVPQDFVNQNAVGVLGVQSYLTDQEYNNSLFIVSDTPIRPAVDSMTITDPTTNLPVSVTRFNLRFAFSDYFAGSTLDVCDPTDENCSELAKASWSFDGSGNIDAQEHWTLTGLGNSGSNQYAPVTDGTSVPLPNNQIPLNVQSDNSGWMTTTL